MSVVDGEFTVNEEADEIRWCTIKEAMKLATYDRDHELLEMVAALPEEGNAA
jgi:8-oxo-dGTP diphosphatase